MDFSPPQDYDACTALSLPAEMPVMVLSECYLFPGCFLPLFIFEQRYRDMIKHALQTHRMFCIGTRESKTSPNVLPISTAGLVHSCVKHDDGTSHLILMGLRRIRLVGWKQESPFPLARIEPVATSEASVEVLNQLRNEALENLPTCHEESAEVMQNLSNKLRQCENPELVCDILAYHFIRRCKALRAVLTETCAVKRYQTLLQELKARG
jgi:Lon protease-like protein